MTLMQSLIAKAPELITILGNVMLALVILGTIITKALGKSFPWIDGSETKIVAVLHWLPTLGIHPATRALEDAYNQLKSETAAASHAGVSADVNNAKATS